MSTEAAAVSLLDDTPTYESVGTKTNEFNIELSTKFLEHFSEQLYSSPQKAFEELISNGWDAAADYVDVRVSPDLSSPTATMCVLDNGTSMDADGLRALWRIASSPKRAQPTHHGRRVIGKFGIGKLATYVLANKLTYICKASDGVIRRITMDYSEVESKSGSPERLLSDFSLRIYELTPTEVKDALTEVADGDTLLKIIEGGIIAPDRPAIENEFGGEPSTFTHPASNTWTLAILSHLKPVGRELKVGVLRRMLEAALPFESEMAICLNGEVLASSKINTPIAKQWAIGPDLKIEHIELEEGEAPSITPATSESTGETKPATKLKTATTRVVLANGNDPVPYIELPGIGRITGTVKLFADRISGGKSEERGASNGFHVNVLGRVVNQSDPSFGEENLSHAAWARFRMTVRVDGLNEFLITNREQFKERREIKIFRAFLRKVFNMVRTNYDSDANAGMPDGGDVLVRSLGVLSLNPLRNVVSDALSAGGFERQPFLKGLFDEDGVVDSDAQRESWRVNTADNIKTALKEVIFESRGDDELVKFRLRDNTIVVNKDHPFVIEHSKSKAEKELVRTMAMVNLLTDVFAADVGVEGWRLEGIREYRDRIMRFRALQSRQSGLHIAQLLRTTEHDSDNSKHLERVVMDALRYIGYHVTELAKSGEPEGIASAYPTPTFVVPTSDNPNPPLYSFTFDAKSSRHEAAATNNLNLAGIADHRNQYKADYALVVAPGFAGEAVVNRCTQQQITPMKASDLGLLLEYTVEFGAIPVTQLRDIFSLYDPDAVSAWVLALKEKLSAKRTLTIDIFLKALDSLKGQIPDALPASTIALICRTQLNRPTVTEESVISLATGLSILVPDLVGVTLDKVVVNASSQRVGAAVAAQLDQLHNGPE